jgi:hypothetical protein
MIDRRVNLEVYMRSATNLQACQTYGSNTSVHCLSSPGQAVVIISRHTNQIFGRSQWASDSTA